MSESKTITVGPGLPTCLTLIFITLKLTHVIAWSWFWVLSPMILPLLVLALLLFVFLCVMAGIGLARLIIMHRGLPS